MKVLHLITHLGPGGIERWLLSMLEQIPRAQCLMDICCKGDTVGPYAPLARELGSNVHHVRLGVTQVGFVNGLRRLVTNEHYDVIHNHLQSYSGLPAFACRSLGVPVITSFHCTAFPPETWLRRPGLKQLRELYSDLNVRYALHHSAMLTGCSQDVVDTIRNSYGGSNGTPWRVLYYGTDLPPAAAQEERREFRRSFGWEAHVPIIVHVGRFAEQKNHVGLIRVFQAVRERIPDAKLLLIGGGALRPAVEDMVRRLDLSDSARFLGYREDVPSILTRSDLFLFPSLFEGLGVAALEASAAGIPVVASTVAAIAEAVDHGVTGVLRPANDIDGLANAAIQLLSDRELALRLGQAGRERIKTRFSKKVSAEALLGIYDECLS
jgi:glycosyltransferase involved in cell wall biosynthesis